MNQTRTSAGKALFGIACGSFLAVLLLGRSTSERRLFESRSTQFREFTDTEKLTCCSATKTSSHSPRNDSNNSAISTTLRWPNQSFTKHCSGLATGGNNSPALTGTHG